MLPEKFIFIGVIISLIGSLWYIKTIISGETKPNLISWFIWMLGPFLGVFFQIKAGAGLSFLGVFMAGFTSLLVLIVSLLKKNAYWKINTFDLTCGAISLISLIIYVFSKNLGISILFAILGDSLAYIPTIRKAWNFPETENGLMYSTGIISNVLALLIIDNWIFPIYSFSISISVLNLVVLFAIYRKNILKTKITS